MDLNALVAGLDLLVLERVDDRRFARRSDLPTWASALSLRELPASTPFVVEEVFPFLASFAEDAEAAWRGRTRGPARSDLWTTVDASGDELHLEAVALPVRGTDVLIIARREQLFAQRQVILQRARELRLAHDAFMREMERKDILVHAVVHDLAGPLHGILGALSLLSEQHLDDACMQWVRTGLQAAMRQRTLIEEILEVFASETGGPFSDVGTTVTDVCKIASDVVSELAAAAERQDVRLEMHSDVVPCLVAAEDTRLFRVLMNLVNNALRYSPRGGTIIVTVRRERGAIVASVEDEGPGVPPDLMPQLFEKFSRGRVGGHTGLGLYFCRITIEGWGGQIGYEPRETGGARFWLRLPPEGEGATNGQAVHRGR